MLSGYILFCICYIVISVIFLIQYSSTFLLVSVDEEETENKRMKYKEHISDLEKQFSDLKDQ